MLFSHHPLPFPIMERKSWIIFNAFFFFFYCLVLWGLEAGAQGTTSESYRIVSPKSTGEERGLCTARGKCVFKVLTCPSQCPHRKPINNRKTKGCFIDCVRNCEATCKWRLPNCNGYGSLCYDPRFVGGDGTMFYFHGAKDKNFAIVSDETFQINAHFIGTRPQGRTRDFTWVQSFAVIFNTHTLILSAKKVPTFHDAVDTLTIQFDGETLQIPTRSNAEWRMGDQVAVERTDSANAVKLTVTGLVEMNVKVRAIGESESKVHKYELPSGDAFAHLETGFRFMNLTDRVEGVLGKTYRRGYVSPVKRGVWMPMMGGEDKYETPSLLSPLCKVCRFRGQQPVNVVADI